MGRNKRNPKTQRWWPTTQMYLLGRTAIRRAGLQAGDTVVVGVSGGPDSCALMRMLSVSRKYEGFKLQPAHLIHDFRGPESYDDAAFVRRRWPDCIVEEVDVAAYQQEHRISSFEQAARDLRYAFLERIARQTGARLVALGHTADDLAETVLLHVARGAGLHGLRGMSEFDDWPYPNAGPDTGPDIRADAGLKVWRPMLAMRRSHTIAYCRAHQVAFRDDSTNYMREFARNRLRLDIMPTLTEQLNPRIVDALARLSRTASTHVDYVEQQADALWPEIAPNPVNEHCALYLDRSRLALAHPALQHIILRRAWIAVTGQERRLTERHLSAMASAVSAPTFGKTVPLPRGFRLTTQRAWAMLSPPGAPSTAAYPELRREFRLTLPWGPIAEAVTKHDGWEITCRAVQLNADTPLNTGNPLAAYLSPSALAEGATVRAWQPGDRIQPLGMAGRRKLQDVFTDARIDREQRHRIPLVVTPQGIAWAVGVRLANWAAVPREPSGAPTPATLISFRMG